MATKISSSIRRFGKDVFEEQMLLVNISIESLNRFTNWKSNRPVDPMKVDEIIKSIKSGLFTPQAIHTFLDAKTNQLVIFDGGHRMTAYKNLFASSESESQLLTNYLGGCFVTTVVMNPTDKFMIEKFRAINMSTPVPEIYKTPESMIKDSVNLEILKVVPKFVERFKKEYKCCKTTNRPHKPSYNASVLCNDMFEILTTYFTDTEIDLKKIDVQYLMDMSNMLNTQYKNEILKDPTSVKGGVKIVEKATLVNCFIFLKDSWKDDFVNQMNQLESVNALDFDVDGTATTRLSHTTIAAT
tara:strand:- start:40 stop:936 length:897 start_codon:yes stop_codon:yes gene_type:complete